MSATLSGEELAAVADWLQRSGVPISGTLTARLIAGGRSNLTFALAERASRWVLRMPPRVGRTPSAHDVAREYRVTAALSGTAVPVPRAIAMCEDESVVGAPFLVSAFVDGRTLQTRADLAALAESDVAAVARALVTQLAALHRVDVEAVGLAGFGRPDGYAERQLRRWSGQWRLVGHPDLQLLHDQIVTRLQAALPQQRSTGIVHGDYRIDNTLLAFGSGGGGGVEVAAIVDWELSTIGDPVADVAMMCAYRHPAFDLIVGTEAAWTSPRLPDVDALAGDYEGVGGVPLADFSGHLALAYYKIAVIAAGIGHRRAAGAGDGAGFDTAGQAVEPFLAAALEALGSRTTALA
ncbi:MAG: phosphotransferase family protein [Blastococcus sp.]